MLRKHKCLTKLIYESNRRKLREDYKKLGCFKKPTQTVIHLKNTINLSGF